MDKLGRMFDIHGLIIRGTDEQIEKYTADKNQYDYVRAKLEDLIKYAEKYATKEIGFRYARLQGSDKLIIVNKNDKNISTAGKKLTDVGKQTKLFIYKGKTNTISDEIDIDTLDVLKNDKYVMYMESMISSPMQNGINEKLSEELSSFYEENKSENVTKYKPIPIDNNKQSLTAETGFYVGDPSLVLKDEILKGGVKTGKLIHTGIYNIDDKKMVIVPTTNGCHSGHDIYSGTIGVMPLEFVDIEKMKLLPSDSIDIRIGKNLNLMMKQNKLYLAQSDIDEIDTAKTDVHRENTEQYSL